MSAPTDRYFNTSDKYFSVNYEEHEWEYLDGVRTQIENQPSRVTAEKKKKSIPKTRILPNPYLKKPPVSDPGKSTSPADLNQKKGQPSTGLLAPPMTEPKEHTFTSPNTRTEKKPGDHLTDGNDRDIVMLDEEKKSVKQTSPASYGNTPDASFTLTPKMLDFDPEASRLYTSRKSKTVYEYMDLDITSQNYTLIAPNQIIREREKKLPPPAPMSTIEREGWRELLNMIAYQQRPQKVKKIVKYKNNGTDTKITTTYKYTPMPADGVAQPPKTPLQIEILDSPKIKSKIGRGDPIEKTTIKRKDDGDKQSNKRKFARTDNWKQTTIIDAYGTGKKGTQASKPR